jgi:hypothetical protein
VRFRSALMGSLLLLAGCRQPNPEWKGPDNGITSDPNTTSNQPDSGMPPDEPMTEGQHCNNDNMCPDGWVCGPEGCQLGMEGDPCSKNDDCVDPAALCGPQNTCQDGSEGDPCSTNDDCMDPSALCGPQGTCQDGNADDPCSEPGHCATDLTCMGDVCG